MKAQKILCRFGKKCNKSDCMFVHIEQREIDNCNKTTSNTAAATVKNFDDSTTTTIAAASDDISSNIKTSFKMLNVEMRKCKFGLSCRR